MTIVDSGNTPLTQIGAAADEELPPSGRSEALLTVAVIAVYLLLSLTVQTRLTGDGPDYAASVFHHLATGRADSAFWDAGHLLWRPSAYLFSRLLIVLHLGGGSLLDVASRALITLSWIGGGASAVLLTRWLRRLGMSQWASFVTGVGVVGTNAFLDYNQGGSAYIVSLSLLVLGLYLVGQDRPEPYAGLLGGVSLALAVLLWLPFIFGLPGALLSPLLLANRSRPKARPILYATAACAVVGLGGYAIAAWHLDIRSAPEFLQWFSSASHGVTKQISGVPRAVVGFGRSFINIGADGTALKRFVLHDPLNPVSVAGLLTSGLWKLGLFYVVLVVITVAMWRSVYRSYLAFCAITALPILAFAVYWQGGDTERYLALYPAFFLALAACISSRRKSSPVSVLLVSFVALMLLVNTAAHSRMVFAAQEDRIVARMSGFNRSLLPPSSVVVMPTLTDPTVRFFMSGSQDTSRIHGDFRFYTLVWRGVSEGTGWRHDFAVKALEVFSEGGKVWLSKRLLVPRPAVDWDWVEGENRGQSWKDFPEYFLQFNLGQGLDGADGFIELPSTANNVELLRSFAR